MRWLQRWKRGKPEVMAVVSPLDNERITHKDPLFEAFVTAMREGKPVMAIYDQRTGQIISTEVLDG